jgi:CHAT domain-containing protein
MDSLAQLDAIEHLDDAGQERLLADLAARPAAELPPAAEALKSRSDALMRTSLAGCLRVVGLMETLAARTQDPACHALALLARANACTVVMGEYRQAVDLYAEAADIYAELGLPVRQAVACIGQVIALGSLGRAAEALETGEAAAAVLRLHAEWFHLARLQVNLAVVHSRLGQDAEALARFDAARDAYHQLGQQGEPHWLRVELNRAVVLRNLGRFPEAIAAAQSAAEAHDRLGQPVAAARARQTLAMTLFVLGRYNEALDMLDRVVEVLRADQRSRQASLAELFMGDCLLNLRRFEDALEKSRRARRHFLELGTRYEAGQALLNEAGALSGLNRPDEALLALDEARRIFLEENNPLARADADLQAAGVHLAQGQPAAALVLAEACAAAYAGLNLPVPQGRARLTAARAALALDQPGEARRGALEALHSAEAHALPALEAPCRHLLGLLDDRAGQPAAGLEQLESAILSLEAQFGRLMLEYRAAFLEDKALLYEDAADLALRLDQPQRALGFAERTRSRALLDLLARRLDLSVAARSPDDAPLVAELHSLRGERDRLHRRLESGEGYGQRGETLALDAAQPDEVRRLLELERRITELWHRLLVRSADYARDAALWQVRVEPAQPYLQTGEVLLEYFAIHGRLAAFIVTPQDVQAVRLEASTAQVEQLLQLLWLNLRSAGRAAGAANQPMLDNLQRNADGILARLHALVMAPLEALLAGAQRLLIAPYAALHYLPFAALYNGNDYLAERVELAYLPGSSLLRYLREGRAEQPSAGAPPLSLLALANSHGGRLPNTLEEARQIAAAWPGPVMLALEEDAALARLQAEAGRFDVLHLATHGDFRPDNPLFSGLALADGWLATLDVFNLHLKAGLVTLSACQTGRSVVGGGDELFGLMRAFLAAGATALAATHWPVEDRSAAQLMAAFYRRLAAGEGRAAALGAAQGELLHAGWSHPYFWAPYFLAGEPGRL